MLRIRYVWALAAGHLLAPTPAHSASGQLVLSRKDKDEVTSRNMQGANRASDDALLVFDFDRAMLFHGRAAGGAPIGAIKKFFITWKSDDGTRAGYLNRVTLEAVEQDGTAKTAYAYALSAQLSFKAAEPESRNAQPERGPPLLEEETQHRRACDNPGETGSSNGQQHCRGSLVQPAPAFSTVAGLGTGRFLHEELTAAHAVP